MMFRHTKMFPEVIETEEQMDRMINRLNTWAAGQYIFFLQKKLSQHQQYLNWYDKTNFKGRYKTWATQYHERAKVILIKYIYDRCKN